MQGLHWLISSRPDSTGPLLQRRHRSLEASHSALPAVFLFSCSRPRRRHHRRRQCGCIARFVVFVVLDRSRSVVRSAVCDLRGPLSHCLHSPRSIRHNPRPPFSLPERLSLPRRPLLRLCDCPGTRFRPLSFILLHLSVNAHCVDTRRPPWLRMFHRIGPRPLVRRWVADHMFSCF